MISLSFPVETFYVALIFYSVSSLFYFSRYRELSLFFLFCGFLTNLISEISGRLIITPFCNMFSEPFFLPLFTSTFSLFLFIVGRREEALSLIPLTAILALIAGFFSEGYYPPFTIMSKSIYAHIFHLLVFTSHGLFIAAAYLSTQSLIKRRSDGFSWTVMALGFSLLCISGLFGMMWSYMGRGDLISWNHYYFHSIALWFYYVGILHLSFTRNWRDGERVALLWGGILLIFVFDYLPQIGGIHAPSILNTNIYKVAM